MMARMVTMLLLIGTLAVQSVSAGVVTQCRHASRSMGGEPTLDGQRTPSPAMSGHHHHMALSTQGESAGAPLPIGCRCGCDCTLDCLAPSFFAPPSAIGMTLAPRPLLSLQEASPPTHPPFGHDPLRPPIEQTAADA